MISIETIRIKLRSLYINMTSGLRGKVIKNKNITVISNNCWSGFIYQSYRLQYNSPTIGLFFMPYDYIEFLKNLRALVNEPIEFIKYKESKYYNYFSDWDTFGKYPIGKFKGSDIEIHFLHYNTNEEARESWERRCKRINWDKLIVKFNDQNGCTQDDIRKFDELNFKNKLCFVSSNNKQVKSNNAIRIKCKGDSIETSYEPFGNSKYININELINNI